MFELMTGTDALPVSEDVIVEVQSGMNKVSVSVGDYVSEPSDVYIVTSEDGALLRTFIVFFIVEPGNHVIYGYAGNPYDPAFREEVLQESVDFVEEMGAILEEVSWGDMSPEERRKWIDSESIYPVDDKIAAEEIVDLEEIPPEELREVDEEGGGTDEEIDLSSETMEPESVEEDEPILIEPEESPDDHAEEEEAPEVRETEEEEKVAEDGDFDTLLKQAFLKPDLVKKSKMKKDAAREQEPPEEEEPVHDEGTAAAEDEPVGVDEEPEGGPVPPSLEEEETAVVATDEDLAAAEDDEGLSALIQELSEETYAETADGKPQVESKWAASGNGDQTRMTVIRYLSRF